MASIFSEYAQFYDALYAEKEYEKECDFLEQVFEQRATGAVRAVLDLGCGTGGHALCLARRGYRVTGVDQSSDMLAQARRKSAPLPVADPACDPMFPPEWRQAAIQDLYLDRTFDAIISMFAVMSYMVTNADLLHTLRAARRHLQPGGLFVFDAWHGPGVLTNPPSKEMKEVCYQQTKTIRFAHPVVDTLAHTCAVHYRVLQFEDNVLHKQTSEVHTMRYLFPQEVHFLADATGFAVNAMFPEMELDKTLDAGCWIFTAVLIAR